MFRDLAAVCPDLADQVEKCRVRRDSAAELRAASFRVESPDGDLLVLATCALPSEPSL